MAAVAVSVLAGSAAAYAQSVSVTLNGNPISLTPAPQERAGRIFVPLRGIFEQLGASVVYQNGVINAQGNGNAVSLHIGSTQATVNGQPQTLDVAPFVIGASTYVPLRFVSQALGAHVNYDAANKLVALSNGGTSATAVPQRSAVRAATLRPARDSSVAARRPSIEAQFASATADPNSLRVTLDDLDITGQTSRSPAGFVYSPPSDLQSMRHVVAVTGKDINGSPFLIRWTFTSGTSAIENQLSVDQPRDGSVVATQFTVSGRTLPGALVVVQVGSAAAGSSSLGGQLGSILGLGGGASARNEIVANADGSFSTVIQVNAPPGANLQLVVNSTDPQSKAAARPVRRALTVQ